ncbi:MAG: hypothetical protein BGO26_00015 [Actinobacteria bacterium 69-20]|jgi:hypothetical protein|nr:MAG: hypothetical protein BGO26_00015 [Actinobacteria bacterium 69-20]
MDLASETKGLKASIYDLENKLRRLELELEVVPSRREPIVADIENTTAALTMYREKLRDLSQT